MKAVIKWITLVVLIGVSIADFFFNKEVLLWSSRISFYFQENGGKPVYAIGILLSTIFTFWMPAAVIIYNHLSNNSRDSLYHFVKYFLAVSIGIFFKMLMYQGRPYLACEDIKGCTCDPGMPSGHAIMAISGYYMIYVIFTEKMSSLSPENHPIRASMLKVTCCILSLGIIWSRIALGAHSVDQLFLGSMISINVILWFDKASFEKIYDILEHRSVSISLLSSFICFILAVGFLFLNHQYREDRVFLQYWDKCPKCKGTMVVSQSLNAALFQIVPGALLYYPYRHKKELQAHHESYAVYSKRPHRFGVFFMLVVFIPVVLLGVIELINTRLITDVYIAGMFLLITIGPLAFYCGIAMSYFNELAYAKFGLDLLIKPLIEYDEDNKRQHSSSFFQTDDEKDSKPIDGMIRE